MKLNYDRQSKMFNPKTENLQVRIFGCGSIGSNLAYMLAKVGFQDIEVIDFDKVSEANITPQMFELVDLDKSKVKSIQKRIKRELGIEISILDGKIDENSEFDPDNYFNILAFDSLKARRLVYEKIKPFRTKFMDIRTGGKNFVIYVVDLNNDDTKFLESYDKSLHKPESELLCGEKTAFYLNSAVCAEATSQLIKIAKGYQYQRLIMRNFDDFEFVTNNSLTGKTRGDIKKELEEQNTEYPENITTATDETPYTTFTS